MKQNKDIFGLDSGSFHFLKFLFILCVLVVCLHLCLCEGVRSPELGPQTVMSCRVGAEDWTQDLQDSPVFPTTKPSLQPLSQYFDPEVSSTKFTLENLTLATFCSQMAYVTNSNFIR